MITPSYPGGRYRAAPLIARRLAIVATGLPGLRRRRMELDWGTAGRRLCRGEV